MPRGDRTGPMGQGPRTGRALGFCAGYDTPGTTKGFGGGIGRGFGYGRSRGRGMGYGRGYGMGRDFGWPYTTGYYQEVPWMPTLSKIDEIKLLKAQAESLSRSQKDIEKRLSELEQESD
jgi:hypothetical protein